MDKLDHPDWLAETRTGTGTSKRSLRVPLKNDPVSTIWHSIMSLLGTDSTENLPHTHTLLGIDSTHTYTQTYTLTRTHTLLALLIAISWAVNKAETLHQRAAKQGVCSLAMEPRPVMGWKDLPPMPPTACTLALSVAVTDTTTNINLWKKRFIWFASQRD